MKITIDSAGRIVIPKSIRVRLGLEAGGVVNVRERDGLLELEPAGTAMTLTSAMAGLWRCRTSHCPPDGRPGTGDDRRHPPMIAVDTSVMVVAAFASWHEGHAPAAAVFARSSLACRRRIVHRQTWCAPF